MKVSYNWLQTFFDSPLPSPDVLAEKITFHSSEVEELIKVVEDTVIDIKVLPDKSAWMMSHRGVAKDISTILGLPLANDPFITPVSHTLNTDTIKISLDTPTCDYYGVAVIAGVTVGPSPAWLQERLAAIGQRSINNIVDANNYVMFAIGQPLHAFDADKIGSENGVQNIVVRAAKEGESIVVLTGETYNLSTNDTVIVDGVTDTALAIAGVKGGQAAAVHAGTTNLIIESAHFDRFAVRKTAQRLKLRTDASARYENGVASVLAPRGLTEVVTLILELAGGQLVGYQSAGVAEVSRPAVEFTLAQINSVLGVDLSSLQVTDILNRFGYSYTISGEILLVTPPPERDDLVIAEDLIEEIGRMYGFHQVVSIAPTVQPIAEFNKRHYYAEKIRQVLVTLGFSEIYTSSFREKDIVRVQNALASDKGYLRSNLNKNLSLARDKNIPHRDLLGLSAIRIFEIGTVFATETESVHVCLAAQTGTAYKTKVDDILIQEAIAAINETLGLVPDLIYQTDGIIEFSLDAVLPQLPEVTIYDEVSSESAVRYQPFSVYPAVSRDIAMWVDEGIKVEDVEAALRAASGALLVRLTHLDTFTKDGRTSLAFRLVFQSNQKTLDGSEVDALMASVYDAVAKAGFEAR